MLTGCIVTDKIDWTQPNVPPSIVSTQPAITRILVVDLPDTGSDTSEEAFQVTIREPNGGDVFVQRFVWLEGHDQPVFSPDRIAGRVPVSSTTQEAVFPFLISHRFFEAGKCARVELDVTDQQPADDASTGPEPARAVWWVAARNTMLGSVEMTRCPQ